MSSLRDIQRNWEILARSDPMWAALMDPAKMDGGWDPDAFFAAGVAEIDTVLSYLRGLGIEPNRRGRALDFGCGVGRLTQALARQFALISGVDISPTMIELAAEVNQFPERCNYVLNEADKLTCFGDDTFAFIYTSVVLQHMEPRFAAGYVSEFCRVLGPGGILVFQVPDRVEPGRTLRERAAHAAHRVRTQVGLRTRARRAVRRVGLSRRPPNYREAVPEMHCLPEREVRAILTAGGVRLTDVQITNATDTTFVAGVRPDPDSVYAVTGLRYLDDAPTVGFVSKQYCAVKPG